MILGRYRQQPGERRKRGIDYDDFLEIGELITDVTVEVSTADGTAFVVDDIVIDPAGKKFAYYAQGGVAGMTYTVEFSIETNGTQIKQDTVEFDVEEDV